MAVARIYQRSRNAMQSGKARADQWVMAFESGARQQPDPLTGWAGGADTDTQVRLSFKTLDEAKAYAERRGIAFHVVPAVQRKLRLQAYADNFR